MNQTQKPEQPMISKRLEFVLEQLESVCIFDKNSGENPEKQEIDHISVS